MAARPTDTKEAILRLGMEFIQTYGYNAFSYADISKELKIKNAAVHYHFPGKEDLLAEIVEQYIPVSYTHLDVYKRQLLQNIFSRKYWRIKSWGLKRMRDSLNRPTWKKA